MKARYKVMTVILFTLITGLFIFGFIRYNNQLEINANQVISNSNGFGVKDNDKDQPPEGNDNHDVIPSEEEPNIVPNLVGMTLEEAESVLQNKSLSTRALKHNSGIYEENIIFWQNIEPGEEANEEDDFVYGVSNGPLVGETYNDVITVPSLIGMEANEAASKLIALGLDVEYEYSDRQDYDEGLVYSQNYLVDARVEKGTSIIIRVSQQTN